MGSTALFGIIHGSHYTISANFYLYLQYFQQKVFSFSKINRSQIDLKSVLCVVKLVLPFLKSYHDFLLFSGVCGMHLCQNLIFSPLCVCICLFLKKRKWTQLISHKGSVWDPLILLKLKNFC